MSQFDCLNQNKHAKKATNRNIYKKCEYNQQKQHCQNKIIWKQKRFYFKRRKNKLNGKNYELKH